MFNLNALGVSLFLHFIVNTLETTVINTKCPRTEDEALVSLTPCFRQGERFIKRFIKRQGRSSFNRCEEYEDFKLCMDEKLMECPDSARRIPEEWLATIDLFTHSCNPHHVNYEASKMALECMMTNPGGVYAEYCNAQYLFNIEQKTQSTCHFLHSYLHCKARIVNSVCGHRAAKLMFLTNQMDAWHKEQCHVQWLDLEGFRFNDHCPIDLVKRLEGCMFSNLETALMFEVNNTLIAVGDVQDAMDNCSAFRQYDTCLNEWRESCPEGVSIAMQQNDILRLYLLKMQYICENNGYLENMECYQEVLREGKLDECVIIWERIIPLLNMTAHEYYCDANNSQALLIKRELSNLARCYESNIQAHCGIRASQTMYELSQILFTDPNFLRFKYIPDCDLHDREPYDAIPDKVHNKPDDKDTANTPSEKPGNTGAKKNNRDQTLSSNTMNNSAGQRKMIDNFRYIFLILLSFYSLVT